jgi:hypothetical protein
MYDQIDEIDNEIWLYIPPIFINGQESYMISSYARIKNHKGRISEGSKTHHSGYVSVSIYPKSYLLHRLVAHTFIVNPMNKEQVNHIDGNKQNNHLTNLEWVTNQENTQHAYDTGLKKSISINQYDLNNNYINTFKSIIYASRQLNLSYTSILNCVSLKSRQVSVGGYIFKRRIIL